MKLSEAAKIMNGELIGQDAYFFGAASDTRKLKPGELFFAWKGERFDAHDYLESAEMKGAICAVVERFIPSAQIAQIVVKDSQKALAKIAKAWRKAWKGTMIALTGSNGKTTLKEMITSILSVKHEVLATEGNYNNHVGCPLMLLRLNTHHTHAVIEMGANHPKEIEFLTKIVQPDIAILNNAGACHLEGFGSLEGVAKAKSEIFMGLSESGTAIINADDAFAEFWQGNLEGQKVMTFGIDHPANVMASDFDGQHFHLSIQLAEHSSQDSALEADVTLQLLGRHNILNALAATAATYSAGEKIDTIVRGLETLTPVKGRLQVVKIQDKVQLINDAYNANPNSLKAGIDACHAGIRWLVLGNMRELGSEEVAIHQDAGRYAKEAGFTKLFALGELAAHSANAFGDGGSSYENHEALLTALQSAISEYQEDALLTILLKGSNSMNMQFFYETLAPSEIE